LIRRYFRLIKLGRTVRSVFARYDVGGDYRAIDMILVIVVLILVGGHKGSGATGELCKNPKCNKDPDSIFLFVQCRVQPGRRKPPVRKTSLNA
jgi:hypothetical protein